MSLTLDVSTLLNNEGYGGNIFREKESGINTFNEFEYLLKENKNSDNDHDSKHYESNIQGNNNSANLDFLSTNCTTEEFLLPSDTQSLLGEDTLLYTVEQDRLQPISSKFMMPGIYKRIADVEDEVAMKHRKEPNNVYISELEGKGRILKRQLFYDLYIVAKDCGSPPPPKVLLIDALDRSKKQRKLDKEMKQADALNRLALDILKFSQKDEIVIDRKRNEIIRTQYNSFQKIVYRIMDPKQLDVTTDSDGTCEIFNEGIKNRNVNQFTCDKNNRQVKLGRPRKDDQRHKQDKRTKSDSSKTSPSNIDEVKSDLVQTTRSGRLVKGLEKHLLANVNTNALATEPFHTLLNEVRDASYYGKKKLSKDPEQIPQVDRDKCEQASAPKRKVPPEAICPTCQKIFLGRRLQKHFAQHPDHMKTSSTPLKGCTRYSTTNPNKEDDMTLFRFLITKLHKSRHLNEDQKAYLFLSELDGLVEQLQLRCPRLIRNTTGLHVVTNRCSRILGIPEGQYALDLSAIESSLEGNSQTLLQGDYSNASHQTLTPTNLNTRSLDYTNLSITIDETLTDEAVQKLNLSAGGKFLPPSEESLLSAVHDLVQADINKMHSTSVRDTRTESPSSANVIPPHIDHVSDNAVEAVNMKETPATVIESSTAPLLDLSVDFFQFNN